MDVIKPKLIIDTDAGHDDALAMMMLACSGKFDILAVTTVAGNSTIDKATRNAQAVLDLIESPLPIYSGAAAPLTRELVVAEVHGDSGIDGLDVSATQYTLTGNGPDKIAELITAYPNEVTVLTLGPLTNVAQAFAADPTLATKVKQVVMMGGAIEAPGNKNRVAEFNFFVDPEAVDVVMKSDAHKVMVPLDPCNDIHIFVDAFAALDGKKIYIPLTTMMEHFIAGIEKFESVKAALVYDALAAYYLLNPAAYTLEPMDIVIETTGEHTAGMSIADRRKYSQKQSNVLVATAIEREAFERDLITYLQNAP